MWKLSTALFRDDEEDQDDDAFSLNSDGICSLSTMQALIVFAKPIKFAVLFTFGNILAVGSTTFLLRPVEQVRMMFDPVRMYATVIYVSSVAVALICALWIHSKVLTIIAIICEICALIWYSLSYIPFARRAVSHLMVRLCDMELSAWANLYTCLYPTVFCLISFETNFFVDWNFFLQQIIAVS